jgi:outer membrane lipoprotein SlyB
MTNPDDIAARVTDLEPEPVNVREPFWQVPSRTWIASQVTILGGIAANAIGTGWGETETKAILLWAVAAVVSYLVPDKA